MSDLLNETPQKNYSSTIQKIFARYPRFFGFVKKRLTPNEKFGLYLTVGIVVFLFFAYFFFKVLENIISQEKLLQADLRVNSLIQNFHTPSLNKLMLLFTNFGQWQVVFLGVLSVAIILALLEYRHYLTTLLISVLGGEAFVWLMKKIIERPRPIFSLLGPESDFSFPSGHAFVAFSFYGLLAYFCFSAFKNKFLKTLSLALGLAIIVAIGVSRIYLGAHWASDVLASYAAGAAWLTILITALEIGKKFSPQTPRPAFLEINTIKMIGLILLIIWVAYAAYFFKTHPLENAVLTQNQPAETQIQTGKNQTSALSGFAAFLVFLTKELIR